MNVDLSRLPTGSIAWTELVDHALTLGDLSEVGYLELKGTLPLGTSADRKRSAAILARTVIGMANRMPDVAAKHLGGHGVVLIGVRGDALVGAERIDGADLRNALKPYLGDDGPDWDYTYINHPRGLVLAVTVSPPAWGDRIHTCRKTYMSDDRSKLAVRDGDVFVRHPGATDQASSRDIAELERRRAKAPHSDAIIHAGYDSKFYRLDSAASAALVAAAIHAKADKLLDTMPKAPSQGALTAAPMVEAVSAVINETRRNYESLVDRWRREAMDAVPTVAKEFERYELGRGHFTLNNDSDLYFEAVRAELLFPPEVTILRRDDTRYRDHGDPSNPFNPFQVLPKAPRWGEAYYGQHLTTPSPTIALGIPARPATEVEATDNGPLVTWDLDALRPHSSESSLQQFAVTVVNAIEEMTVRCKLTARGVHHVFENHFTIGCAQAPDEYLQWQLPIPAE